MSETTPIERLIDLEDIKRLKARRDHAVDMKDWVTYEALHAPDACSYADGVEPLRSAAVMTANVSARLAGRTTAHHSHSPDITFESRDKAKGIWAMEDQLFWKQGDEDHFFHGLGFYHETYERQNGQWVFTSRELKRTYRKSSPGAILQPLQS